MKILILVAVLTVATCAVGVSSLSSETVANSEPVQPSFDVAPPVAQEPASAPEVVAAQR